MSFVGSSGSGKRAREIDKNPQQYNQQLQQKKKREDVMWGQGRNDEDFLQEILGPGSSGKPPLSQSSSFSSASSGFPRYSPAFSTPRSTSSHIKKRRRLLPEETSCLVAAFERSQKPGQEVRDQLAARLRMSPRAIQIWFQNRRAKVKRDAAEAGKASLSFVPAARAHLMAHGEPGGGSGVVRRIEPAGPPPLTPMELTRFEDLFQMPAGNGLHGDPSILIAHSHKSSIGSSTVDASTPLTWEDPAEWATNWSQLDLPSGAGLPHGKDEGFSGDLWMDDFLEA